MPHYMVYHSCDIDQQRYQAFATAVTKLHCELFSAPSAFVNISFLPTHSSSITTFVSSNPHPTNFIHAHLRPRGLSNAPKLRTLVSTLMNLWDAHINTTSTETIVASRVTEGRLDDPMALHNVFIFEDLAAGVEQGFLLPQAGQEEEWVKDNMEEFEKRAAEGDENVKRLMEEMKAKGESG